MLNRFKQIGDENDYDILNKELENYLGIFLKISILTSFIILLITLFVDWFVSASITSSYLIINLISYYFYKESKSEIVINIVLYSLLLTIMASALLGNGIRDVSLVVLPAIIVISGIYFHLVNYILFVAFIGSCLILIMYIRIIYNLTLPGENNILAETTVVLVFLIVQSFIIRILTSKFLKNWFISHLNEVKYKDIFDNLSDIYIEFDSKGRILEISPSIQLQININREELLNKKIDKYFDLNSPLVKFISSIIELDNVVNHEIIFFNETKPQIFLGSFYLKVKNANDPIFVGILKNITEIKFREGKIVQAQKMEALVTLAGGMAHEFNNLLSGMFGYTDAMLSKYANNKELTGELKQIVTTSTKAKDLIEQILAFSRKTNSEKTSVNIVNLVNDALNIIKLSKPSHVNIKVNIDENIGLVRGNSNQITQILIHLFTNAVQSIDKINGRVEINLSNVQILNNDNNLELEIEPGNYIELKVSDNGMGIPKKLMNKIFDPYFTTKDKSKGDGLGLSTVYGLVKEHNGSITVYSQLNIGSTFIIYLPFDLNNQLPVSNDSFHNLDGKEHILFLDDEEYLANLGKILLEPHGYSVDKFSNAIEALAYFKNHSFDFDLIITDLMMPYIEGDEFAKEIRKIRPDIPIIICTGFNASLSDKDLEDLKINSIIRKPILTNELLTEIRKIFKK